MPKGLLVVQTRPVSPDRVDEYHDWYDNKHIPALLTIPGVVSARRYRATGGDDLSFMAVYELEADDLNTVLQDVGTNTGATAGIEVIQLDPAPVITVYEQLG